MRDFFTVTFEQFEEKKKREHEERMCEATVRDKQLAEHPYSDHMAP